MWYNFRKNIIILDCEMSGLDLEKNQLLEIAAIKCDPRNLANISSFHSLVGPVEGSDIQEVLYKADPKALLKNNLYKKRSSLSHSPTPGRAVKELLTWLPDDYILAGYNIVLDLAFLKAEIKKLDLKKSLSYKIVDIAALIELYRAAKPGIIDDWSLRGACNSLGVPCIGSHNALEDCESSRLLLIKLLQLFEIK